MKKPAVHTEPGFLLINKPSGPTSHTIVRIVKRVLGADSVGHLGTLDPFASGVLPILVAGATRLADEVHEGRKGYRFTIGFGKETDTLDRTGRTVSEASVPADFAISVAENLPKFSGLIEQVPPLYSALKMDGLALYEHMRSKGSLPRNIETKKRPVMIHELTLLRAWDNDDGAYAELRLVCEKGTYVRSLARDISKAIGTVGTCVELCREMVEPWTLQDCIPLLPESPPNQSELITHLRSVESLVPQLAKVTLDAALEGRLASGNTLRLDTGAIEWNLPPDRALVEAGKAMFLCETQKTEGGGVQLQPRKKIR